MILFASWILGSFPSLDFWYNLDCFFFPFAIFGMAAYMTSVMCCISHWRGRMAGRHLAVFGVLGAGLVAFLWYQGGATHTPQVVALVICMILTAISLIPALSVVRCYRRRFTSTSYPSGARRYAGIILGVLGAISLIVGVTLWVMVPDGVIDYDSATKLAARRAENWFFAGTVLSAIAFYVGLKSAKWESQPPPP